MWAVGSHIKRLRWGTRRTIGRTNDIATLWSVYACVWQSGVAVIFCDVLSQMMTPIPKRMRWWHATIMLRSTHHAHLSCSSSFTIKISQWYTWYFYETCLGYYLGGYYRFHYGCFCWVSFLGKY